MRVHVPTKASLKMWSDDRSRKPVGALDYAVVTLTPGSQGGTSIGQGKGS